MGKEYQKVESPKESNTTSPGTKASSHWTRSARMSPANPFETDEAGADHAWGMPAPGILSANLSKVNAIGRASHVQPKLRINQPDDPFEREADRVADAIAGASLTTHTMRDKELPASTKAPDGGATRLNRSAAPTIAISRVSSPASTPAGSTSGGIAVAGAESLIHEATNAAGSPLDDSAQREIEGYLGEDLSAIRIHTGARAVESAEAINARAYTFGTDIVFNANEYAPHTSSGLKLLAHEITHVIQQNGGGATIQRDDKPGGDANPVSETHGGIVVIEIILHTDTFRLTLDSQGPAKAQLGITSVSDPSNQATKSIEVKFPTTQFPLTSSEFGLPLRDTGRMSISERTAERVVIDLGAGADQRLTISDEIDKAISTDDQIFHKITIDGPGISGKQIWLMARRFSLTHSMLSLMPDRIRKILESRNGYPSQADRAAEVASAMVPAFREQDPIGSFEKQITSYEEKLLSLRHSALENHLITNSTYMAWNDLRLFFMQIRRSVMAGIPLTVSPGEKAGAARAARALYTAISAEVTDPANKRKHFDLFEEPTFGNGTGTSSIHYFTATTTTTTLFSSLTAGPGVDLPGEIEREEWSGALESFTLSTAGLDKWIERQIDNKDTPESKKSAQSFRLLRVYTEKLRAMEGRNTKRAQAVFVPRRGSERDMGPLQAIPMDIYYWLDGSTWHMTHFMDLNSPPDYTEEFKEGDKPDVLPNRLLQKLDDKDIFPTGTIYYEIPGFYSGHLSTTGGMSLKKFLLSVAEILGAIGLVFSMVATLGADSAFALPATVLLTTAAFAGGTAATLDLIDRYNSGRMDPGPVILDAMQIVSLLAGATAATLGKIKVIAQEASLGGNTMFGNMSFLGGSARIAALAENLYIPLRLTKGAADVVSVVTFTAETLRQYQAISNGFGTKEEIERDQKLFISQLLFSGGLMALSFVGEIPRLFARETIVLQRVGGTYAAGVGTEEAILHLSTPRTPSTGYTRVQMRLSPENMVEYLTSNVQGLTREQAAFLVDEIVVGKKATIVLGGSRVRGDARIGGADQSDLDVGFYSPDTDAAEKFGLSETDMEFTISRNQFTQAINKFNEKFAGVRNGEGRIIESNRIFPGSESNRDDFYDVVTPEESFMRQGFRPEGHDQAGKPVVPSGFIRLQPDGVVIRGIPH